jgi:hypothetical protein
MSVQDFINDFGVVFYRNGKFYSEEIKKLFKPLTEKEIKDLQEGERIWCFCPHYNVDKNQSGFTLNPVVRAKTTPKGKGMLAFKVTDEKKLLSLIQENSQAFDKG